MIPENLIIDDYDIKTPNKVRDDSFQKFCDDMDIEAIMLNEIQTEVDGETITTTTSHKFDKVTVKRNKNGEISHWQTAFKVVE